MRSNLSWSWVARFALGFVLVLVLLALLPGCTLEPVVVPPKVAKALDLPANADGPYKGQVTATPEQAKLYREDFDALQAAAEAKAKAERNAKATETREKAEAAAATAERAVRRTKTRQASDLQNLINAQAEEIDTIGQNAADEIARLTQIQRESDRKASETLAGIAALRASTARAFDAAEDDQKAREERRLGALSGAKDLGQAAAGSVGGPWGAALAGGLGLLGGWLGLSKPADKKAASEVQDQADSHRGTVQTLVKAIHSIADPAAKTAAQNAVAAISTPDDELNITDAKAALKV